MSTWLWAGFGLYLIVYLGTSVAQLVTAALVTRSLRSTEQSADGLRSYRNASFVRAGLNVLPPALLVALVAWRGIDGLSWVVWLGLIACAGLFALIGAFYSVVFIIGKNPNFIWSLGGGVVAAALGWTAFFLSGHQPSTELDKGWFLFLLAAVPLAADDAMKKRQENFLPAPNATVGPT